MRDPPRDGKGFKGFLPRPDEFYFTTGKKKISENARAGARFGLRTSLNLSYEHLVTT
jgi:hypothetical protein